MAESPSNAGTSQAPDRPSASRDLLSDLPCPAVGLAAGCERLSRRVCQRLTPKAEEAGVSEADWKLAQIGWQVRLTTSTEVKAAIAKAYDPKIKFRRTYGV